MRIGPANMPRFSGNLTDAQVRDVVAYVTDDIQHPTNPGGAGLGGVGPGGRGLRRPPARRRGPGPHLLLDRRALVSDAGARAVAHQGADADRHPERSAPGRCGQEPGRGSRAIIAAIFVLAIVMTAGFGAAYWQNWNPWILGGTLGAGLFLLGFGLTAWGKYLMPQGPFVEERHVLAGTPEERDVDGGRPGGALRRGGQAAQAAGRPLRPRRGDLRDRGHLPAAALARPGARAPPSTCTDWRKGSILVDSNGRAVHKDTLVGGRHHDGLPARATRTHPAARRWTRRCSSGSRTTDLVTDPGRETWAPAGYVAYSKVCTHLGCPVGLYEQELELLVCPCHQSMFNVRNGAVPQFGPAPRPLPQLPLDFDATATWWPRPATTSPSDPASGSGPRRETL